MKRVFASLLVFGMLLWGTIGAYAADSAVKFTAQVSEEVDTGEPFSVRILCAQTDDPTAGVLFTLTIPDGYALQSAEPGERIERAEFSYSYSGSELILMYLDSQGGESGLQGGEEIAVITLMAGKAGSGKPLECKEIDASAVTEAGEVIAQSGTMEIQPVTAAGDAVELPVAPPSVMEEGEQKNELLQGVTGSSGAGTVQEAISGQDGQEQSVDSEPNIITDAEGNRIQVIDNGSSAVVQDITSEVMAGQPATAPEAPAQAEAQAAAGGALWWVAGGVAVVAILAAVIFLRTKNKDRAEEKKH